MKVFFKFRRYAIAHFALCVGITVLVGLYACHNEAPKPGNQPAKGHPATQDNPEAQTIPIKRYEQALFAIKPASVSKSLGKLYPEYSFFLGKNWNQAINFERISNYLADTNIRELYKLTQSVFPGTGAISAQLTPALDIYHREFPQKPVPHVFTYVSGLDIDNPVYYADTAMAIGLDCFLGKDQKAYRLAGVPVYKSARMVPGAIAPACMKAIGAALVSDNANDNTLLAAMIRAGKILYFQDATLPEVEDYLKIGYSPAQMQWCNENEANIWSFFIERKLLFTSDPTAFTKFLNDGPFTAGLGEQAPPRLAEYLGWQIVRRFASKNSSYSLEQVLNASDAQQVLKGSGYKPRK